MGRGNWDTCKMDSGKGLRDQMGGSLGVLTDQMTGQQSQSWPLASERLQSSLQISRQLLWF